MHSLNISFIYPSESNLMPAQTSGNCSIDITGLSQAGVQQLVPPGCLPGHHLHAQLLCRALARLWLVKVQTAATKCLNLKKRKDTTDIIINKFL